ncbi:MAG TPA: MogA/MoaB family molybdenum cofactor biosynthesis protein [Candidatus Limnocylindria bacterium]|nr:MogA/MoaB family molybdenum cofactor biosynthesis protein [Candidatus Limnocylindria bacterium]
MALRVVVVTVGDSISAGQREDVSGPAVRDRCAALGWQVVSSHVVSDDSAMIQVKLRELADAGEADIVVTTGGTGVGPRDSTPEATMAACEKLVPGLAELMRQKGQQTAPRAMLSRAAAGIRGRTLIVNLPGSPKGAVESLDAVAELIPHAVEVLHGARHE